MADTEKSTEEKLPKRPCFRRNIHRLAYVAEAYKVSNQCVNSNQYQSNRKREGFTMNQIKPLTTKQDSFCVYYTTIGAETFSNGTKSALAAGYSEKRAYARGSELLRNRKVLDRICELHTENMQRNMITVDKVLADLEHDKLKFLIDDPHSPQAPPVL